MWLSSVHYLSFQTYTFGLYVRNALSAEEYAAFGPTLQNYSFSDESTLFNVAVLVGLAVVLRWLAYLIVLRSKSLRFS